MPLEILAVEQFTQYLQYFFLVLRIFAVRTFHCMDNRPETFCCEKVYKSSFMCLLPTDPTRSGNVWI